MTILLIYGRGFAQVTFFFFSDRSLSNPPMAFFFWFDRLKGETVGIIAASRQREMLVFCARWSVVGWWKRHYSIPIERSSASRSAKVWVRCPDFEVCSTTMCPRVALYFWSLLLSLSRASVVGSGYLTSTTEEEGCCCSIRDRHPKDQEEHRHFGSLSAAT